MKNLLPFFFCAFSFCGFAQTNTVMSPEANIFYSNAMSAIKPEIKSIIEKNANNLKGRKVNIDSLSKTLRRDQLLKNASPHDIEAITVLIMVQTSRNADADLKQLVINMPKTDQKANREIEKATQKRVENILANKSHIAESVSSVMKKIVGSQDIVIDNLR